MNASILWRRLDRPGHESARIRRLADLWELAGSAVFALDGLPCSLQYAVMCDTSWRTVSAHVNGWLGNEMIEVTIEAEEWRLNGVPSPQVAGCIDVDLNFSPSTNMLPIRRLNLAVGEEATARAAWLRFPSFTLEPLEQTYRRTGEESFRYESGKGSFVAELQVNEAGFVVAYGGIWLAEAETFALSPRA